METARKVVADAPPATLTDEEIVARVCGGEGHLFEQLMRRHNQQVYRAVRAILRDEYESEDVMQDAYVRAYEHLGGFEGRSKFSTWLTRIALHEALARARRHRRFDSIDDIETMPGSFARSREQHTSDVEVQRLIERAVGTLPEHFRSAFVLRAVQGMSGAEVAQCLDLPEATVKTRLVRARARLKELLVASSGTSVRSIYDFHLSRCDRIVTAVLHRLGIDTEASTAR
jgi:RNA polymerase sigma-70 factor (ECF subfamily)